MFQNIRRPKMGSDSQNCAIYELFLVISNREFFPGMRVYAEMCGELIKSAAPRIRLVSGEPPQAQAQVRLGLRL